MKIKRFDARMFGGQFIILPTIGFTWYATDCRFCFVFMWLWFGFAIKFGKVYSADEIITEAFKEYENERKK